MCETSLAILRVCIEKNFGGLQESTKSPEDTTNEICNKYLNSQARVSYHAIFSNQVDVEPFYWQLPPDEDKKSPAETRIPSLEKGMDILKRLLEESVEVRFKAPSTF